MRTPRRRSARCAPCRRLRLHRHAADPDDHLRRRRARASKTEQGATLAAVRIGIIGALVLTALADRRGRRRVLLVCAAAGCVSPPSAAWLPGLVALGVAQTGVRGLATAGGVLVVVVAAEEMPAGSRAFAITLIGAAGALGAGLCLMVLPLADLARAGGASSCSPRCSCSAPRAPRRPPPPESRRYEAAARRRPHGRPRPPLLAPRRVRAPAPAVHRAGVAADQRVPPRRGGVLRLCASPASASSPTPPAASGS